MFRKFLVIGLGALVSMLFLAQTGSAAVFDGYWEPAGDETDHVSIDFDYFGGGNPAEVWYHEQGNTDNSF